nr:hypothetical protein [Desulfobulbaceae bacterium]
MLIQRKSRTDLTGVNEAHNEYPTIFIEIKNESDGKTQHQTHILDINDSGMGVTCEVMLKVGQQISFSDNQTEWDLPESGIVMWTFQANDGFRAGIKFS